jgi:hypothetical protein
MALPTAQGSWEFCRVEKARRKMSRRTGFYYTFIGVSQLTAALLLLIPRTTLLGAIIYFPIICKLSAPSLDFYHKPVKTRSPKAHSHFSGSLTQFIGNWLAHEFAVCAPDLEAGFVFE